MHASERAFGFARYVVGRKTGRGQVQRWFLFEYRGQPALVLPQDSEFVACAWRPFEEVERGTADFRRALYKRLRECFNL